MYETTNWGLYDSHDSDDDEPFITEDSECSNCGKHLDLGDGLAGLDFQVEESGVAPSTVHGYAVHWAIGTIRCPNCEERLHFETSS